MTETITEKEFQNMIKLNNKAVKYFELNMEDILKAQDLSEATRNEKESPAEFHKSRREAITRIVLKCRQELQKRVDELQYYGTMLKADKIFENTKSDEVLDRELNELVNGKYPITLYINQVFNAVMEAENMLGRMFRLLPVPAYKK